MKVKLKQKRRSSPTGIIVLLASAIAFKVLLFPLYHSTDFEVHRNWLAITHSLPMSEWYTEHTSEWTLDYPPLFAWFERAIALIAKQVDGNMLSINNLNYASDLTIIFQRSSVIFTELVLILAVCLHCKRSKQNAIELLMLLIVFNPGLLIVDHIHFQYNGLLLGMLMLSLIALQSEMFLVSALLFAILLNMKHLFAVAAPYYFVYMLRKYCVGKRAYIRFVSLGIVVIFIFGLSLGPFIYSGNLSDILSRLFPFGRGLCHAYWAPNFWALYSCMDKILLKCLRYLGFQVEVQLGHLAGGVVGVAKFAVLPQISPLMTLACMLFSMAPCLWSTWKNPRPSSILEDLAYVNLCGFMFGKQMIVM